MYTVTSVATIPLVCHSFLATDHATLVLWKSIFWSEKNNKGLEDEIGDVPLIDAQDGACVKHGDGL